MDKFQNFSLDGVFLFGKFSYENARQTAVKCEFFTTDSGEDELVDSDPKSCYNCLFRRWSKESFECLKLR